MMHIVIPQNLYLDWLFFQNEISRKKALVSKFHLEREVSVEENLGPIHTSTYIFVNENINIRVDGSNEDINIRLQMYTYSCGWGLRRIDVFLCT